MLAKYIIHTVGPSHESEEDLKSCYKNSLKLAIKYNCRTIVYF